MRRDIRLREFAFFMIAGTIFGCANEAPPTTPDDAPHKNTSTLVVTSSDLDIVGTIIYTFRRYYPDKSNETSGQLIEGMESSSADKCGSPGDSAHPLDSPGWFEIQGTSELGLYWELDELVEEGKCIAADFSLDKRRNNLAVVYTVDILPDDLPAQIYINDQLIGEVSDTLTPDENEALLYESIKGPFDLFPKTEILSAFARSGKLVLFSGPSGTYTARAKLRRGVELLDSFRFNEHTTAWILLYENFSD